MAALKFLKHDITMSPVQWESWLIFLQDSIPPCRASVYSAYSVINDLFSSAKRVHGVYRSDPTAPPISSPELHNRVAEGLFIAAIRQPTPWNPAADAISKPPSNMPVIAPPSFLSRRITAAEVLATMVADLPTPAYEYYSAPPVYSYEDDYGTMPALHYSYEYPVDSVR